MNLRWVEFIFCGLISEYSYKIDEKPLKSTQFSKVFLATRFPKKEEKVIVKAYNKVKWCKKNISNFVFRVLSIIQLDHPNIVKYHDIYEDDKFIYLVMEHLEKGSLYDKLTTQGVKYTEVEATGIARQLLSAISVLHRTGDPKIKPILHWELNLKNIYFDAFDRPKIVNFGVSEDITLAKVNMASKSELIYYAPEVIIYGRFSPSSDMYSLGAILYTMLMGYRPYSAENVSDLISKMNKGLARFSVKEWKKFSKETGQFIKNLLTMNEKERFTAKQALAHPWIHVLNYENIGIEYDLSKSMLDTRKSSIKFNQAHHSHSLTPHQSREKFVHRRSKSLWGKNRYTTQLEVADQNELEKILEEKKNLTLEKAKSELE
jgi:calcium-dependent protein kinase